MEYLRIYLLFFTFSIWTIGYSNNYESSRPYIELDFVEADSTKFESLDSLVWDEYLYSNPVEALKCAQNMLDIAHSKREKSIAFNTYGTVQYMRGKYDIALKYYNSSLKLKRELDDPEGLSAVLSNMAAIYKDQGKFTLAMKHYMKSLEINERIENVSGIAVTSNNIGIIYYDQGNFEKAKGYFFKGLEQYRLSHDSVGIGVVFSNIGLVYYDQLDYKNARSYFEKSLVLCRSINDLTGVAVALNNLGNASLKEGFYERSSEYFDESILLNQQLNNTKGLINSYNNMASLYLALGDSLSDLGNHKLKKTYYSKGVTLSIKALDLAHSIGSVKDQLTSSYNLYKLHKGMSNTTSALDYYEQYVVLLDSIFDMKMQQETMELEYEFILQKKVALDSLKHVLAEKVYEAKMEGNLRSVQLKWTWFASATLLVLVIVFFIFRLKYLRVRAEQQELFGRIKQLKTELQVKNLASETLSKSAKLNKDLIESQIDASLNPSDWAILEVLFQDPGISNKDLADQVSLSLGGTRSSLQKLYRLFEVKTSRNQRLALIVKASEFSGA